VVRKHFYRGRYMPRQIFPKRNLDPLSVFGIL